MSMRSSLILASGSAARSSMLLNAGVSFDKIPADIDEHAILQRLIADKDIAFITEELAREKALHISRQNPEALVIGSDQTLSFEGEILSKAKDADDARAKLIRLRGQTHTLVSSVCMTKGDDVLFAHTAQASLTMHNFSDVFLDAYMKRDPDALTSCVGAYKIEGAGAWLFSSIEGDVFTIMGMPLLPLLDFLHKEYGVTP